VGEVLNGPSGEFEHRELRLTAFPKKEGGVREKTKERGFDNDSHGATRHQVKQKRNRTREREGKTGLSLLEQAQCGQILIDARRNV
jgi:hypothetical protein